MLETRMDKEKRQTRFLVLDDKEQTWFIVDAMDWIEAVEIAKKKGYDPYFVVEEQFARRVWQEEERYRKMLEGRRLK